jgi:hypothetical protein|tara:strand:+ start:529 stop:729 length:201 start_codon:yes stop_codon:yes gene_type:complete
MITDVDIPITCRSAAFDDFFTGFRVRHDKRKSHINAIKAGGGYPKRVQRVTLVHQKYLLMMRVQAL